MHKIGIFIPYFGKWPDWAPIYFETLRRNSSIDFIFFTDCDPNIINAPNIRFHTIRFDEYVDLVNSKLDFKFQPENAYKLCDLRPLFGYIHEDIFRKYDFYGWIDVDLLLGDLRSFYTDQILANYDVFSTHAHRISGHFALFRNNEKNRNMYKKIYRWKEALQEKPFIGIDEHGITNAYLQTVFDKFNEKYKRNIQNFVTTTFSDAKKKRMYMVEQYTTPFLSKPWLDGTINSDQPDTWYYKNGNITNERDGDRKFIYLHFMNFKSSQWRHDGTQAPWEGMERICRAKVADMDKGLVINKNGILPFTE
jgi:hypothetical protein